MKVLVTGCSGLLGSALCHSLRNDFDTIGTFSNHAVELDKCKTQRLDITNLKDVSHFIAKAKPDFIIHSAALVGINACDKNPELARKINVEGTKNVAEAGRKTKSRMIYISTDYVFDGKRGIYRENDSTAPINLYGITKLDGEKFISKEDCIVRTSIHGWPIFSDRPSFSSWVIQSLMQKQTVNIFNDQFNTMILVNNLAKAIIEIIKKGKKGIYNVAGSERCSKYDFARKTADIFGLDRSLITPIETKEELKATRPMDVSLDISKSKRELKTKLLNADGGLKAMKELHEQNYLENFKVK